MTTKTGWSVDGSLDVSSISSPGDISINSPAKMVPALCARVPEGAAVIGNDSLPAEETSSQISTSESSSRMAALQAQLDYEEEMAKASSHKAQAARLRVELAKAKSISSGRSVGSCPESPMAETIFSPVQSPIHEKERSRSPLPRRLDERSLNDHHSKMRTPNRSPGSRGPRPSAASSSGMSRVPM
jgi:hypothetical protein